MEIDRNFQFIPPTFLKSLTHNFLQGDSKTQNIFYLQFILIESKKDNGKDIRLCYSIGAYDGACYCTNRVICGLSDVAAQAWRLLEEHVYIATKEFTKFVIHTHVILT